MNIMVNSLVVCLCQAILHFDGRFGFVSESYPAAYSDVTVLKLAFPAIDEEYELKKDLFLADKGYVSKELKNLMGVIAQAKRKPNDSDYNQRVAAQNARMGLPRGINF